MIEKREFKRVTYNHNAEVQQKDKIYSGLIDNLSARGLCLSAISNDSPIDFVPGSQITVTFSSHAKEKVELSCKVKWSKEETGQRFIYWLGLEIIDPPWDNLKGFI